VLIAREGRYLKEVAQQRPLDDPRHYLHMICWNDLQDVSAADLDAQMTVEIPFVDYSKAKTNLKWKFWKPPHPAFKWLHHLHTEDEVFEYCMVHLWHFPGLIYGKNESILFLLKPVEECGLLSKLNQFWDSWVRALCQVSDGNVWNFALTRVIIE